MIIRRTIKLIDQFVKWGGEVLLKVAAFMLLLIVIFIASGVFMRATGSPITWPEEVSGLLFVWVAFLGAGVATARKQHIFLEFLSKKFNQTWHQFVVNILILVFLVIVITGGVHLLAMTGSHSSGALGIPRQYYYLPLSIMAIYMFVFHLGELLKDITKINNKKEMV